MRALLLLAAVLVVSCKPSPEKLRQAVDAVCTPKKAAFDARAALLAKLTAEAERVPLAPLPPPKLEGKPLHFAASNVSAGKTANVMLATLQDLKITDPAVKPAGIALYSWHLSKLKHVRRWGCGAEPLPRGSSLEQATALTRELVNGVLAPKYLAVVRRSGGKDAELKKLNAAGFRKPEPGKEAAPMGYFEKGTWRGAVLVFELATGRFLGGVPVEARSSHTVKVTGSPDPLADDMYLSLQNAVTRALMPFSDDLRDPGYHY